MKSTRALLAVALTLSSFSTLALSAHAQVTAPPTAINFQGRLTTPAGNPVPDAAYSVRFRFYDAATAGSIIYEKTIANVQVKNGTFAVIIDGFTAANFNGNTWLGVKVGSDTELSPRTQIISVPYALKANLALTVPDGSINTNQLAASAVNSAKLADNAVTQNKIADNAVIQNKIVNGAVVAAKIADNAVTNAKLASDAASLAKVSGGALFSNGTQLGIGTTNPTSPLSFRNADERKITYFENAASGFFGEDLTTGQLRQWIGIGGILEIGHYNNITGAFIERMRVNGNGNVGIGTTNPSTKLEVAGTVRASVVEIMGGSDVAEPYHVAPAGEVKPVAGMLVCIDEEKVGQMRVASRAYDSTVAGIISGANGINPGITLRQKGTVADGELPVASIGRVWCYCDADANGAIKAGDLLTTSDTPGHAMKISDFGKSNGTVIGKAMSSLKKGKGLVLVLVSLK